MNKSLIIFNVETDWFSELELKDDSEFGMDAEIFFTSGRSEIRHNLTEFHHRYDREWNTNWRNHPEFEMGLPNHMGGMTDESAFESDIHGTGGTIPLSKVQMIVIKKATSKNEEY